MVNRYRLYWSVVSAVGANGRGDSPYWLGLLLSHAPFLHKGSLKTVCFEYLIARFQSIRNSILILMTSKNCLPPYYVTRLSFGLFFKWLNSTSDLKLCTPSLKIPQCFNSKSLVGLALNYWAISKKLVLKNWLFSCHGQFHGPKSHSTFLDLQGFVK